MVFGSPKRLCLCILLDIYNFFNVVIGHYCSSSSPHLSLTHTLVLLLIYKHRQRTNKTNKTNKQTSTTIIYILYIKTQHDSRFYELKITIPETYPATPPIVRFVSKINMPCVDPNTGLIINDKLPTTKNWNRNMGIEQILSNLRKEMGNEINRKLKQPPDGSTF